MVSKDRIESVIRDAIKKVSGISSIDENKSLIGRELNILPVYFLYIFNIIEEELALPVCEVLEKSTYEVMTVHNLVIAIDAMQKSING